MRLLLDTHTLLWYGLDDPKLSTVARTLVLDADNEVFVSPASFWEIAIKVSIGKLAVAGPFSTFVEICTNRYRFETLPILPDHTAIVAALPFPDGHRDPFDRMLIAQCSAEGMDLVSSDETLDVYDITRRW